MDILNELTIYEDGSIFTKEGKQLKHYSNRYEKFSEYTWSYVNDGSISKE